MAASPPRASLTVDDLLAAAVGAVPGGSARAGQQQMAEAVAEAVRTGEHLLVQAGTGTGKSLAYLAPALLVDGAVVVSTATLALQHQLVDHDLPRLAAAVAPLLGREPTFAVLKGRHHYICMAKLDGSSVDDPNETLFDVGTGGGVTWLGEAGRLGKQIQRLRDWAMETETGDRDDLEPGVEDAAWRLVSTPARECVGAGRCPYADDCFVEAARAQARESDIVVTNHSLLSVDLIAGRHIIPPHKLLVIDEAHELADRVSSASQAELTTDLVDRAARRVRPLVAADLAEALVDAGDGLAAGLVDAAAGRLIDGLPPALHGPVTLLDAATRQLLTKLGEVKSDDPDPVRKQMAIALLSDISGCAQRMLAASPTDVIWIERDDRRRAIVVAPLSVAMTLREHLYDDRTVVAASATLALGGAFDTTARTLGLPVAPAPAQTKPARRSSSVGRLIGTSVSGRRIH